ncbi:MAG: MerR family transcriptional regulator [Saprospiraceae bacterium]|nr:MerR family transcriptional regulator [Saprospiraceae bacterium]
MSLAQNEKLYYSIGEVAEMFNVSKSLIRFWESEFDLLKPHKNSKGDRKFTKANIEQFQIIYNLVKQRGFTLDGAKKEIKTNKENLIKKQRTLETLRGLKKMIGEAKELL